MKIRSIPGKESLPMKTPLEIMEGKTVSKVEKLPDYDFGFLVDFTDGTCLKFCYSMSRDATHYTTGRSETDKWIEFRPERESL